MHSVALPVPVMCPLCGDGVLGEYVGPIVHDDCLDAVREREQRGRFLASKRAEICRCGHFRGEHPARGYAMPDGYALTIATCTECACTRFVGTDREAVAS